MIEQLLRRRINASLRPCLGPGDYREKFHVRPILRQTHSTAHLSPYRLRQWGVWLEGLDHPVGYVATTRAGQPRFWPYPLSADRYSLDGEADQGPTTGQASAQ